MLVQIASMAELATAVFEKKMSGDDLSESLGPHSSRKDINGLANLTSPYNEMINRKQPSPLSLNTSEYFCYKMPQWLLSNTEAGEFDLAIQRNDQQETTIPVES
jgi:hypothetical protein